MEGDKTRDENREQIISYTGECEEILQDVAFVQFPGGGMLAKVNVNLKNNKSFKVKKWVVFICGAFVLRLLKYKGKPS